MEIESLISIVSNLGFPIFTAVYLMLYNSKIIKENTEVTIKMRECIDKLCESLKGKNNA